MWMADAIIRTWRDRQRPQQQQQKIQQQHFAACISAEQRTMLRE